MILYCDREEHHLWHRLPSRRKRGENSKASMSHANVHIRFFFCNCTLTNSAEHSDLAELGNKWKCDLTFCVNSTHIHHCGIHGDPWKRVTLFLTMPPSNNLNTDVMTVCFLLLMVFFRIKCSASFIQKRERNDMKLHFE